ncbi:MAG: Trm112 family protein [Candidatus Hodarchaeales archaeon]
MKKDLMEILACPFCKNPNLELISFEESEVEVITGVILCSKCKRYYPIKGTIPVMLPDDLRRENEELEFLKQFKDKIPRDILEEGKPFNLVSIDER